MTAPEQAESSTAGSACCAASRDAGQLPGVGQPVDPPARTGVGAVPGPGVGVSAVATDEMVLLRGDQCLMGTDDREGYPADGEGPVRKIRLSPFWIDRAAVSNVQFTAFVGATGYVTEAEKFGWAFVFAGLLPQDFP